MKAQIMKFIKEDVNGCLNAAQEQLEIEDYEVHWIDPDSIIDICF